MNRITEQCIVDARLLLTRLVQAKSDNTLSMHHVRAARDHLSTALRALELDSVEREADAS